MKNFIYIIRQLGLFLMLVSGAFLWVMNSSETKSQSETERTVSETFEGELIPERQLLSVHSDSLESQINNNFNDVCNWVKNDNKIELICKENMEREFSSLFFSGDFNLSSIKNSSFRLETAPLKIIFDLEETERGTFITIPAEMVQNILISKL